jgi:zinc transporter 1
MFGLTAGFFLVEIIVGYVTNSMALVADSFHMLSDIAALIIAFMSVKMAPKSWDKNTYGWARAEVLGALVNAVFLVALCFSITIESAKRFYEPEEIHNPKLILIVGALGLLVNILGLFLFHEHGGGHGHSHGGHGHGHSHGGHGTHSHLAALANTDDDVPKSIEDAQNHLKEPKKTSNGNGNGGASSQMNMRGVFLHVLGDALGSVVVIISALIMWRTEWEYKYYVDPALSLVMVCIMMRGVWPLLIESALILLQTVPTHIDVDVLKKKLLENIDGILAVHDFHVWQLTGDRIIASAHIRCLNLSEYMKVAENIKEFFHNEGIHSTTIQPEFVDFHQQNPADGNGNEDCVLS